MEGLTNYRSSKTNNVTLKEEDLDEVIKFMDDATSSEDDVTYYVGDGHIRNGVPFINYLSR